jgi:elongation factor P
MVNASDLYLGQVIRREGSLFRVIASDFHAAGGQLGKMVHTRARNIATGHIKEWRFRPEDRLENVELERFEWEYLYNDGDLFYFMDPANFEQYPVEAAMLGDHGKYLVANARIHVEIYQGKPVHFDFPPAVLRVTSAPPAGHHDHDSSTYKKVILENGMEVLAPQFIKAGEYIKIDTETGKYLERVFA